MITSYFCGGSNGNLTSYFFKSNEPNTGSRPDPDKLAAIRDFPAPKDRTDLRSWMGLLNQFSTYAPDLKQVQAPQQALMSMKVVYQWLQGMMTQWPR